MILFLPSSFHLYTEICILNLYTEISFLKIYNTKINYLPSLYPQKSVSEIDNFKGPYAQQSANYSMAKTQTTIDIPHRNVIPESHDVY